MNPKIKTPLAIISGSLGSGKTTLLRRILDYQQGRMAVVMNEFGQIAIDSQIIQGKNIEMVELTGGCVCCSLTGEFEAAIKEIIEKVKPELIVLEATGVAESDAIIFEVEDNLPEIRLDSVVYIVDAYAQKKFPEIGYVARTQLGSADVVVINKLDLVTPYDVKVIKEILRKYNERAVVIQSQRCQLDVDLLFGLNLERPARLNQPKGHVEFQSFIFTAQGLLKRDKFEEVLAALPSSIYRAKGFVQFSEGNFLFNFVLGRFEFERFPADKTQLVFIGPHVARLEKEIVQRLRECEE